MDIRKSHIKYKKLLNCLRKKDLVTTLREKKGILPPGIVEDVHRNIYVTFNYKSVQKLNLALRKYWKKICNDVQISNADSIVTISKVICDARKKNAYEIVKKYIIETRDADFLNGDIKLSLIRNALMKHRGVDFIKHSELSHCRAQIRDNYNEIKEAIVNNISKNENLNVDSNWSEVSDSCLEPKNPVAYSPVAGTSKESNIELNSSFEEQAVEIKKEMITNRLSALSNELLSPIKEIVIPLERVRVPPKKKSPEQESEKYWSPWFRFASEEEYLQDNKKELISQFQEEKLKLVNTCQGAVQEFIAEYDKALDILFADMHRNYRKPKY